MLWTRHIPDTYIIEIDFGEEKMSTPHISVIIPCYNMEQFLPECLDSVLGQTLSNLEIICVDDGSTDTTPDILDAFCKNTSNAVVIHQENQGVAVARNKGIRKATGEYVAFMDPDDFYPDSSVLELLYTKAIQNNAIICGGSFSSFDNKTQTASVKYSGDFAKYTFFEEGFVEYSDYQYDFGYHRFLYNRKFLLENDILFPLYARFQDPPFFVRAMITAKRFYAVPDVVYRYRCGIQAKPTSWPSTKLHDMMRGHLDNLLLSKEYGLNELHALTVRRFETPYVITPVLASIKAGNQDTMALLAKINAAIDSDMLVAGGMEVPGAEGYLLKMFALMMQDLGHKEVLTVKEVVYIEKPRQTPCVIKKMLVIPRKVMCKAIGAVRCYRENGLFFTVKKSINQIWSFLNKLHSAAPNGSWCGDQRQLSAANGTLN